MPTKKPAPSTKATPKGKKLKDVPGKRTTKGPSMPEYKPHIYLDGKQVPKDLQDVKPGATVTVTAKARVVRRSEGLGGENSVSIELDKMAVAKAGKKG